MYINIVERFDIHVPAIFFFLILHDLMNLNCWDMKKEKGGGGGGRCHHGPKVSYPL